MSLPSQISDENTYIDNNLNYGKVTHEENTSTAENNHNDNESTEQKIPHNKPKLNLKSKKSKNVNNYNIINSSGVKIGATVKYTLNLNHISSNVNDCGWQENIATKSMPPNVQKLCICDEEITIEDMLLMKIHMGRRWEDVAKGLGYTNGQIYQLKENYKDCDNAVGEVIYQFLLDWKQAKTSEAKIGILATVMWSCQEYDCVEQLAESRNF